MWAVRMDTVKGFYVWVEIKENIKIPCLLLVLGLNVAFYQSWYSTYSH